MKKIIGLNLICLFCTGLFNVAFGQDDISSAIDEAEYVKANVALTKFKILGVNNKQYAKCFESENYLNPEKKLKFSVIDNVLFADDGKGYDLQADDGILTSNQVFDYQNNFIALEGTYRQTSDHDAVLADANFVHHSGLMEKITIECTLRWQSCRNAKDELLKAACRIAGWPYGGFVLTECRIIWTH